MTANEQIETREPLELRIAAGERALQATLQELEDLRHAIAHDLRSPLRAISGFGKILEEEHASTLDADGQELLRRLMEGAARMNRMLEGMAELSRLGKSELQRSPFDLGMLAHEVAAGIALNYPERRVEFEIQPGILVEGDPAMVRIVLSQLLSNAVKFTGRRALARIQIGDCLVGGARACFVADNGVGFAPEEGRRIFGLFQRLHSAVEFPGTGLGLAMVHRIITRHEGRVWAESGPDQGTRILFTLGPGQASAG